MQRKGAFCVCEYEERLMRSWSNAVENFSRVISLLTGSEVRSPQHKRLRAEAEVSRLHFENTHLMLQLHYRDYGCLNAASPASWR